MRESIYHPLFAIVFLMLVSTFSAAQSRKSVSAAEVNGSFKMSFTGKYRDFSNDIKILALGGGKLRVAFDLVYPYTMSNGEIMVNLGQLDETATIVGDTAIVAPSDLKCQITIKFVKAGTIKVTQQGSDAECGFGHNVFSQGTYRKVSSKKPTFDPIN